MKPIERIALAAYSAVVWALTPWVKRRLARRALAEPLYGEWVTERFGLYAEEHLTWGDEAPIWIHAVSLGETRAATELIATMSMNTVTKAEFDSENGNSGTSDALPPIVLTHGTATGRAAGREWLARQKPELRQRITQAWQPWDTQQAVQRFFDHFKPQAIWLMETEVWPNVQRQAVLHGIAVCLVNARLSEKSLRQARTWRWLARPAYASLHTVLAQTSDDARRLSELGARIQGVTGNIKFDAQPQADLLRLGHDWRELTGTRPVLILASSRPGEEIQFLEAFKHLVSESIDKSAINFAATDNKTPRLLIVPRHPQRFDEVAKAVADAGLSLSRRSTWGTPGAPSASHTGNEQAELADVWLGDSMGEMAAYAGLSDCALLGGSFEPFGGQNLIELLACGCPVVMGPHTYNFADAAQKASEAGVAIKADTPAAALVRAGAIAADISLHQQLSAASTAFVEANAGAMARTANSLRKRLHLGIAIDAEPADKADGYSSLD